MALSALEIPTVFGSLDEYWEPMLGAQGPIPTHVGSLTEVDRYRLAAQLEHDVQTAPDGSITLIARAWAIRGVA